MNDFTDWASVLVSAVDADNLTGPDTRCQDARTPRALAGAPVAVLDHVALAYEDFHRCGPQPLSGLRSDAVAHRLTVHEDAVNVLVARMVVPGGPWPGHYGLEAVAFTAERAVMPRAFPPCDTQGQVLTFGEIMAASKAFTARASGGAVLFPEQLAVTSRPTCQSFGVVFLDRLTALFRDRVLPLIDDQHEGTHAFPLRKLRQLAFLAHEWGHRQGPIAELSVSVRGRRLVAVIAELRADLEALGMLGNCREPWAPWAAGVLVADRIVREAWLRRPQAQVDAIAARHLLALLLRHRAVALSGSGRIVLHLDQAAALLRKELETVRRVEGELSAGEAGAAARYLAGCGWAIADGSTCYRELDQPVARYLGYQASMKEIARA
ncbi:hypothetical protein [Streptomyces sp. UNOC14_S4]|uniref:hypothetical protein n=1 Tax=Streptomyces sp. UNOC14_S4 TaxID=2872340 RepID=UPI001E547194|nr:hypothetical protein [Streptomyces sp. UNOC14_S4]MCC3770900.1 hypothetical protein [Streptomyces sp. UNOC14_S4]